MVLKFKNIQDLLQLPVDDDFEKVIADYLTFEVNMITHGRAYLFEEKNKL